MFTIFLNFISLLDAFDFADTNTMQDVSRIIYETRTGLVHSRESLAERRNAKSESLGFDSSWRIQIFFLLRP